MRLQVSTALKEAGVRGFRRREIRLSARPASQEERLHLQLAEHECVVVTDVHPLSPAVHVADRSYLVPMADAPGYLDELEAICVDEQVRLLIPTIDDE